MTTCSRRIVAIAALFLAVTAVQPAFAADTIVLKLRYQAGDKFVQQMTTEQDIEQTVMGTTQKTSQTMMMETTQEITGVDTKGVITMEMVYSRIRVLQQMPMGELKYDSADPENAAGPMTQTYAALLGHKLTLLMTPDGKVKEVRGVDTMVKKIVEATGIPEGPQKTMVAQQFEKQFGENSIKQNMQQAALAYPDGPVAVGDSWSRTMKVGQPLPATVETTYTLQGVANGVATVALKGTFKTDPEGEPMMEMGPMKMRCDITGNQAGTMHVLESNGMVRQSTITQDLTGNLTMDGLEGQAQAMTIPMKIHGVIGITTKSQ